MTDHTDNVSVDSPHSPPSFRSRSSTKVVDDVTSLTSFNPFSEEDEHDQSSYALVTSLFSKVKNTLSAPLSAAGPSTAPAYPSTFSGNTAPEQRRPSLNYSGSNQSNKSGPERPTPFSINVSNPAPPLVSLTPVVSETPSYTGEYDRPPSRGAAYTEILDGGGYAIPGFPIQDSDARSIRTNGSFVRSASVSKVIRRIRGEGLSREYWMDDELCKECYDCKSVFTTWRRKHHCRICGQIFCSRCASNIIKGARFGQEGMVRICNLCLDKLAKVDDDEDEDDRRSIMSSMTSPFAAHQFGGESRSLNLYAHPQSPFAASQLFGRTDEPFNLFSIAETRGAYAGSEDSGFGSRPMTPMDGYATARFMRENPVPFRRALTEEDKDTLSMADKFQRDNSPVAGGSNSPIEFPVTVPVSMQGATSSVQFPVGSPEHPSGVESAGVLRSRFNSYADFEGSPPFIRSRVQSRLGDSFSVGAFGEPGWRTRRESTAYAQELNLISMFHLRIMLRQMLTAEDIPNIREWEETLLKLALRIARELTFTAHPHRQGADMDVRRYVKIKKIPGGAPKDSEYVDGAVITKNVAHKQMSQNLRNPRVMLVTFPLEFHRVEGQYMHFGQIFRQEKEYLGNLASRIAALRPHVVLAEKSVSRLALDALAKRQIAVARAVKPSAVQFVARMTQGDVFSSMDKLALEPRLGHCARFRLQTFDHPLIPGRRKTYMRFEGCNSEMGCTILLRGGDIETLRRVKKVTRFLAFMVRNLKLETHLWKDSVITLPPLTAEATPPTYSADATTPIAGNGFAATQNAFFASGHLPAFLHEDSTSSARDHHIEDLPDEDADQIRLSRRIQESLEPYRKTFISVSATLRFPPPYPIRRMKELDDELMRVKREWEDEVIRREERGNAAHKPEESTATIQVSLPTPDPDDVAAQIECLPLPDLPRTPTNEDGTPMLDERPGYFDLPPTASPGLYAQGLSASPLPRFPLDRPTVQLKTADDIKLESQYQYVKWQHSEQRRIWEWYLRKNRDDFQVEKYQCISLWELTLPMDELGSQRACFPPNQEYLTFYGENDCTLGQFIENSVMDTLRRFLDPKAICENKSCNQPLARHCKLYVHNETRLCVTVEQWDGQIINHINHLPSPDTIITWSACRNCGSATPFIPISPEMQRYSFAKFLELHFYPADVNIVQGAGCEHNIYRDHVRYFAIKGMTVRFVTDPIVLHEIVYPPMRIRVRPETKLEIKNTDYERLHHRNNMWYSALIDDLKLINIDAATGEEETDALLTSHINALINKAEWEKEDIARLIDKVYRESAPIDTLALNQVRAYRQDKIVAWQQDFDKLPKPRFAQPDKLNGRRTAFGSVRAMLPKRADLYGTWDLDRSAPASVSEAEEHMPTMRRVTGDSFTSMSSASEMSETESLPGPSEGKGKETELEKSPAQAEGELEEKPAAVEGGLLPPVELSLVTVPESTTGSDPGSDSTIDAGPGDGPMSDDATSPPQAQRTEQRNEENRPAASRLPRRVSVYPSVAELVKKYQDYLPPQGVEDLTKTALAPGVPVSESEQESAPLIRPRVRTKARQQQFVTKRSSVSDFESSYAANIAPKYLTKRPPGQPSTRIPVASSSDSRNPSRRTSPDKRPSFSRMSTNSTLRPGRSSPPPPGRPGPPAPSSRLRNKPSLRLGPKDMKLPPSRPPSVINAKSTFRRPQGAGSKVSNIAKHFERISKDTERANRRYAVIRGKRARPVASARAKVEVLESIKDAINDESDSSDSSEADDEGGGDHDDHAEESLPKSPQKQPETLPAPDVTVHPASDSEQQTAKPSADVTPTGQSDESAAEQPPTAPQEIPEYIPPSVMNSPMLSPTTQYGALPMTPPPTDMDIGRPSILKALTGLWPQQAPSRSRMDPDFDDPMADPEHIFRDSSMVVRTDEPTSIIALALNSPQYRDMLAKSRAEKRSAREPKLTDGGGEAFMPDDWSVAESSSTWGVVNVDSSDAADPTEELRVPSSKLPWQISFESGGLTISCTVLYPEQFDALRRTYDCERSIIESLARCVKFDASGGKSGSAFLKTLDDRFIAKELSRAELQSMETFAPAYFDYMSSAVVAQRPTLLAKIFGCYKITFRKSHKHQPGNKSKVTQMNLLVMENLFYDKHFSKIYDLKGSTRNRHVQSTGRENEVLLDENLVQSSHLTPFYVREHSKRILRGALFNDSRFLADLNVMDYSLVVGVSSSKEGKDGKDVKDELVVGIVDYIRTYTWDKKLESWVKDTAFLGGANRGEPTIIGPKQYRHRFLSAMERYFPLVPDRWMKQPDAPEEEGNSLLDLWPDW